MYIVINPSVTLTVRREFPIRKRPMVIKTANQTLAKLL